MNHAPDDRVDALLDEMDAEFEAEFDELDAENRAIVYTALVAVGVGIGILATALWFAYPGALWLGF